MSPGTAAQNRLARGPAVWALAASMTLIYSTIYYNYAGLILFWTRELGWSKTFLSSGPMLSMLLAALLAPVLGRRVDQGHGPRLLMLGPVLGALGLAGLALVQQPWQWVACWLVLGLAQAACFYEVGFAFLIRRLGPAARQAIIRVTLVAGFASTISFPLYAALGSGPGWRTATWAAAAVTLGVVLPLNWYATRRIRAEAPPPQLRSGTAESAAPAASRRAILLLVLVTAGSSINHWMLSTYIVPILVAKGTSEAMAVTLAACLGPAQVLARLALMWSENRLSNRTAVTGVFVFMLIASGALVLAGAGVGFGLAYVAFQGAAFGAMTILRPVLIADVMGPENYGANAGKILMPTLLAGAMAPVIGAVMLENFGVEALIALGVAFVTLSLLALRKVPMAGRAP